MKKIKENTVEKKKSDAMLILFFYPHHSIVSRLIIKEPVKTKERVDK